jgi:hypothetical protein
MQPVEWAALWPVVRDRVNTAKMQQILGGPKRVYIEGDNYSAPEAGDDVPWYRLIIIPSRNLYRREGTPGLQTPFGIVIRVEGNNFRRDGFNRMVAHDAAQVEAWRRLDRWTPPATDKILVSTAFWLHAPHQASTNWDDTTKMWWTSAIYRAEASRPISL